jgi:hypothetical protein
VEGSWLGAGRVFGRVAFSLMMRAWPRAAQGAGFEGRRALSRSGRGLQRLSIVASRVPPDRWSGAER